MEDKELRQEFARLFNWYEYENQYGYSHREKKLKEPTWAQIYCEIGKLLAIKDQSIVVTGSTLINPLESGTKE